MIKWSKQLKITSLAAGLIAAIGSVPLSALHAQTAAVVITVALPSFVTDNATSGSGTSIVQAFEDAHPGVQVNIVSKDAQIPPAAAGLDNYLKGMQDYVSAADVVYVSSDLSPEATRAGYFLDLQPLVSADPQANADDFYPAMWKSFQWDNGFWALPSGGDAIVLAYDPKAFDTAGLTYPTGSWTVDDLVNAVQKLTQKNADGTVSVNGLTLFGGSARQALVQSLIGPTPVNNTSTVTEPQLDTPAAETVLDGLNKVITDTSSNFTFPNTNPMLIIPLSLAGAQNPSGTHLSASALPGGHVGLTTDGFGVSAGTLHPTEAYELAMFLTQRSDVNVGLSSSSARKSVANSVANTNTSPNQGDAGPALRLGALSPDLKALLDQALNSGLTTADMPYADYYSQALSTMSTNQQPASLVLPNVEAQVIKDQQNAVAQKGKITIAVATPVPVVVAPGKITLKFGLTSNIRPTPNQDQWQQLATDFAKSDPSVGRVDVQVNSTSDLTQNANTYDCFALPFNAVPGASLSNLLNIDPYLEADSTFDRNDVVGNILTQLQQDNKTWALPLMLTPEMMSYDAQQLTQASVSLPTNGWTYDDFVNALKALKPGSTQSPFVSSSPAGTDLLMLMAAAGGLPIDYRTNPPTPQFTDPAAVAAIQQVLDLAKNGYIKYSALSALSSVRIVSIGNGSTGGPAITTQDLSLPKPELPNSTPNAMHLANKQVLFPTGTTFNAISYGIVTAYISAKAQNPDACYRWISQIAQHPELFSAMPAHRSLIQTPIMTSTQGADMVNIYKQIDTLLSNPHTVQFPSIFQGGASPVGFLMEHWLYAAFDAYVLQGADLQSSLKNAQDMAQGFEQCAAAIAPYDPTSGQSAAQYKQQYLACATKVDPSLKNVITGQG